ncbi:MAG TPA: serine hydrolase domain-containing protein [Vicinamibacterales bacterium]|nr:serine hydrolase domain-containing protein [Vicinamibacterales bacterium]
MLGRLAGLLVLVVVGGAVAAGADPTDDFVRQEMQKQRIPGLALAVIKDGVVIKAAGYGVADRKTAVPVTPDTVFKIASVSKQFMATGIMVLVQDGRVSLADSVERFIPDVPPEWRGITIRHLLSHTGGLGREGPAWRPSWGQSDSEVIRSAYAVPLRSVPGTKWEYSNLGYTVLAEIIARVSGRPWGEFIAERVFRPAGLLATRTTTTTERVANRASGYSDNDRLLDAEDWPAVRPGGGFLSTVLDLARWDAVLNGSSILSEASRQEMWTATALTGGTPALYGLGWHVNRPGARRQVWHSGGLPGFNSQFRRYLDDGVTVIVLINLDDADDDSIAAGVAELYLPKK